MASNSAMDPTLTEDSATASYIAMMAGAIVGQKRKRSVVWSYFEKDDVNSHGICDICGDRVQSSGNTSNLFKVR